MFKALIAEKSDDGVSLSIQDVDDNALPTGQADDGLVTVKVEYSTINYKDGLCLGDDGGGLVKSYPHVGGIDFSGSVEASDDLRYKPGDKVVLTGWRVGETWWGGYATKARVKGDWLVPLPAGLTTRQAMPIGTAGFTSMLAIMALEGQGLKPGEKPVLVTGAAGGVGSVATALLAKLGYDVAAVTGRPQAAEYLSALGATSIIAREEISEAPSRPLAKELYSGCIDAVGGTMLANVLTQISYGGSVAAIGLAGGVQLKATILPFLLRGVNLLGIDSVMRPYEDRTIAWSRLATDLPMQKLEHMIVDASLDDVPRLAREILNGTVRGRVVVDLTT